MIGRLDYRQCPAGGRSVGTGADERQLCGMPATLYHFVTVLSDHDTRQPLHQITCNRPPTSHTQQFNDPLSGTTRVNWCQKGKTKQDLLQQETVNGSGISRLICKSAPHSRQITMPAPHHSVFLQDGCPSCCPTNSVKALKAKPTTHNTSHTRL